MKIDAFIVIILVFSCFLESSAQNFSLGISGGVIISQVEGDRLIGFNKRGYTGSLNGYFHFNSTSSLVVAPGYSVFGSQRSDEMIPALTDNILVGLDMSTANVLVAYQHNFGDSWDGSHTFKIFGGIKFHQVVSQQVQVFTTRIASVQPKIDKSDMHGFFPSLNLGTGLYMRKNLSIDLIFDYGLTNLLKESKENISKLTPFHLAFTIGYEF